MKFQPPPSPFSSIALFPSRLPRFPPSLSLFSLPNCLVININCQDWTFSCQLSGYSSSINQLANQRLFLSPGNDTEHQSRQRDAQTTRSRLAILSTNEITSRLRAARLVSDTSDLLLSGRWKLTAGSTLHSKLTALSAETLHSLLPSLFI